MTECMLMDLLIKNDLKYKNKTLEIYKREDIKFSDADYFYEEIRKDFLINLVKKNFILMD